ncbi:MAG: ribonuclease P protein component [bacterium]
MKRYGFSKADRIRKDSDFKFAFNRGRRVGNNCFTIHILRRNSGSRLGIVVSRKVSKHAVHRNRIKRLLREVYRTVKGEFLFGADVVVVVRESALSCDFQGIKDSFVGLLKRAGMLRDDRSEGEERL